MNEQFQSNSTNISEIETHFFFEKEAFSMKMAVNDLLKKSASPRCCSQGCLAPAPALAPLLAGAAGLGAAGACGRLPRFGSR